MAVTIGEINVDAAFLQSILNIADKKFDANAPMTMSFRKAILLSGHDLKDFAAKLNFELQVGDVEQ